jgi:uncharacterized damage-inducible protein DinB
MTLERLTLAPSPGLSPGIGYYLSALNEVREQLGDAVEDISDEHLARRAVAGAHSIGALVLHIGESEWWWTQCVINGHRITDEDRRQPYWDVLIDPEDFGLRGYSAHFCLEAIEEIRRGTRELLATFNDDDLDRLFSHTRGERKMEVSLRWVLHHLADHEAQHKGQILMLKRLLGSQTDTD